MRHVDDGTVHAWLDGQVTDPAESAWIAEHLQWCVTCAARVADARTLIERAHALLDSAAPETESPPFDEIAARAARHASRDATQPAAAQSSSPRLLQLGWAASLILAAGIGWLARDAALDRTAPTDMASAARTPALAPQAASRPAPADTPADRRLRENNVASGAGAPSSGSSQAAISADSADAVRPAEPQSAATAPPPPLRTAAPPPRAAAAARTDSAPAPTTAAPSQTANALAPAAAAPAAIAAPEPTQAQVLPRPGGARGEAFVAPRQQASPPPTVRQQGQAAEAATTAPPERAAGTQAPAASRAEAARETAVANAPAAPPPSPGLDDAQDWRSLPRTEAAARSGMALYGLDGLEIVLTTISPDNAAVRTIYRLPSGATIELVQERESAAAAATARASARALDSLARAVRQNSGIVTRSAPVPRTWSEVRGDVRLSLRTLSVSDDLNAIAARLRVE